MAEIAGLVLGAIPLAIWAPEKYAEPFEEFHKYRISIDDLKTDLTLQNYQLQRTLANAGLENPTAADMHSHFNAHSPTIANELVSTIQRMDNVMVELLDKLGAHNLNKPDALPDKVQWVWKRVKHSLNTSKRKKIIDSLRHQNEDLRLCLERPEVPAEDDSRRVQELVGRFNSKRCRSLRQCLSSLHRALHSGCRCDCLPPHQAAIDLDWKSYESDAAQTFKVAVSYCTSARLPHNAEDAWRKLDVTFEPAKTEDTAPKQLENVSTSSSARSPSTITPRVWPVRFQLSRFKTPPPPSPNSAGEESCMPASAPALPLQAEAADLCAAVSTACIPWTFAGLLRDPELDQGGKHFSLSHRQDDIAPIIRRIPLKNLFSLHNRGSAQSRNPYLTLSAKQRYGIAAATAWSVLHLSGSPWLSSQWDEQQASIFLEERTAGREMLSRFPCLSSSLSMSKSPDQQQPQQPEADFSYLIPNKNVFALGIFLVELCLNKLFADIRQATGDASPAAAPLLEDYTAAIRALEDVRGEAGDSYGYAVERCIKFSFPGRDATKDFTVSRFRQDFYSGVVAPIQATYLQLPDSRIAV